MNRREKESAYWDVVANDVYKDGMLRANIYKAEQIIARILKFVSMAKHEVLEIGVGGGLVAGALRMMTLGNIQYTGTDVSPVFAENVKRHFNIEVVVADVTKLPGKDGQYTRVLCLDSLEHVHPEDRDAGYAEIARVTAQGGVLLINMPLWQGFHEKDYDHPFGVEDFVKLQGVGFNLVAYEAYVVPFMGKARPSGFVVMEKL